MYILCQEIRLEFPYIHTGTFQQSILTQKIDAGLQKGALQHCCQF